MPKVGIKKIYCDDQHLHIQACNNERTLHDTWIWIKEDFNEQCFQICMQCIQFMSDLSSKLQFDTHIDLIIYSQVFFFFYKFDTQFTKSSKDTQRNHKSLQLQTKGPLCPSSTQLHDHFTTLYSTSM